MLRVGDGVKVVAVFDLPLPPGFVGLAVLLTSWFCRFCWIELLSLMHFLMPEKCECLLCLLCCISLLRILSSCLRSRADERVRLERRQPRGEDQRAS